MLRLTCSIAGEYLPRVLVSVLRNQSRNVETSNIEFHESWDYRILNVLSNECQRFLRQRQILAFRTEYALAISEPTQKSCYISWTVHLQYRVLISWGEIVKSVHFIVSPNTTAVTGCLDFLRDETITFGYTTKVSSFRCNGKSFGNKATHTQRHVCYRPCIVAPLINALLQFARWREPAMKTYCSLVATTDSDLRSYLNVTSVILSVASWISLSLCLSCSSFL